MTNLKRLAIFASLILLGFSLSACRRIDADTLPTIHYGEDVGSRCGMIIGDERFAAGLVLETASGRYEHRIFDDLGEMFVYVAEEGDGISIANYFVHDYRSKKWLNARDAFFVQAATLQSPMGFGLTAFSLQNEAQAFAGNIAGEILRFDEAREYSLKKALVAM